MNKKNATILMRSLNKRAGYERFKLQHNNKCADCYDLVEVARPKTEEPKKGKPQKTGNDEPTANE